MTAILLLSLNSVKFLETFVNLTVTSMLLRSAPLSNFPFLIITEYLCFKGELLNDIFVDTGFRVSRGCLEKVVTFQILIMNLG